MPRKLTAILSADVVGYGAQMERDEDAAMERLRAILGDIFTPSVAAHGGRIVKLMGDGALVEFASVVAAARCALEIQTAMAERNSAAAESERALYRIGVNSGDVIVEDGDIFGEGVNVAARLQTLAPPGGIAVSRSVREQIEGRLEAQFEDLGEHRVKEIERPVHVFALGAPNMRPSPTSDPGPRVSVCVLPFANMSGDPEQDYFSDGVTEDIITDLSKVSALSVVSCTTAFTFKGKSVPTSQVARQLNVSHVLEGSVRKAGNRVRITAQLIDGLRDNHLWAERYDRELKDIFALQDEIAEAVVTALKLKLLPTEKKAIELRSTTNPEAYKIYLMARQFSMLGHARHRVLTVKLCQRAVEIDPNYARAWALMAIAQSDVAFFTGVKSDSGWSAAERALSLEPDLAEAHSAKGRILDDEGKNQDAAAHHNAALRLDPTSYLVNCAAARNLIALRRHAEAVPFLQTATSVFSDDLWAAGMAIQCHEAPNHDPAGLKAAALHTLARAEKAIATEPDHSLALAFGVSALVALKERERAREWAERAVLLDPDNINMTYNLGCSMIKAGEIDWGLDLIAPTMRVIRLSGLHWMKQDNDLDSIRDHPRLQAMTREAEARLALEAQSSR